MDRRTFISAASITAATAAVGYGVWGSRPSGPASALPTSTVRPTTGSSNRGDTGQPRVETTDDLDDSANPNRGVGKRVLVVVQLHGGNDALNTLAPADGRYRDLRPTIAVAESDLIEIDDEYGLHPAFAPLLPRWNDGTVAAVTGVGFEGAGRSHFAAMDTWFSGRPGAASSTGWLGRWLDATAGSASPFRSVALGGNAAVLDAASARSISVSNPAQFGFGLGRDVDPAGMLRGLEALATGDGAVSAATAEALGAVELFSDISAQNAIDSPTGRPSMSSLLADASALIERDVGTEVVVVSMNGFDTHAAQVASHEVLLADVFGGIADFLDRIDDMGRSDDVLLLTTSEFGRRAGENGSAGTDHGKAGLCFLAGSAVNGGRVGEWNLGALDDGDLAPEVDARSLYQHCLDWLGGPVEEVLDGRYDGLGVTI